MRYSTSSVSISRWNVLSRLSVVCLILLPGVVMAQAPACTGGSETPIFLVCNGGTNGSITSFFAGYNSDEALNNAVGSTTITVQKGQKFVFLTEVWTYVMGISTPPDGWGPTADVGETTTFTVTLTGLAAPYTSTQTGTLATPPSGPLPWTLDGQDQDGNQYYHLVIVHAFDVSSLTQNAAITPTLQLQIAIPASALPYGYYEFNPIAVDLWFSQGNLALTQTSSTFRPRDARDPAAYCTTADPAGQTHDGDCHPQFTATLTGLETYSGTPTEYGTALISALSPSIGFALTPATPFAPPGTWLPGTSTNYAGANSDSNTVPDYLFDARVQPTTNATTLTVQDALDMVTAPLTVGLDASGNPTATPPVAIKVTSQDFGGKAYLRAFVTLAPGVPPVYARVVDPTSGQNVQAPVDNAGTGGTCGTDFGNHPFASLPVDQDCNGIADWWEGQYITAAAAASLACGGPVITAFIGNEDIEQGYTCNSPQGVGGPCMTNIGDFITPPTTFR
jgi:hypothetical protein